MVPDVSVNGRLSASVAAALTAVLPANVSVPVPPPPPTVWVPVPENTMPPLPAVSAMLPAPALRMLLDAVIVAVPLPVWLSDEPASRFSVWNWELPVPDVVMAVLFCTVRLPYVRPSDNNPDAVRNTSVLPAWNTTFEA